MLSKPRILSLSLVSIFLWILTSYMRLENLQFEFDVDEQDALTHPIELSKEKFIADIISSAVEDDFDQSHIRKMCDSQKWDQRVVFRCHGIIGGIGNIRQELLHCIRYAIDAGAGLLLPSINLRSVKDLSNLEDGTISMDYLFDQDRFLFRMETACPQMTIYKDLEELETFGPVTETDIIKPKELPHWPFLAAYSAKPRVQEIRAPPGEISLIAFERVWRYYPICHDPVGFADTFGNLIPFREDVHRLAATIIYELSSRFHLAFDPDTSTTLPFADTFIGIHLRTASDVLDYWITYDDQANYYLGRIESSDFLSSLPIIYIASGNSSSVSDFGTKTRTLPHPPRIVTKNDLLSAADLKELESLTWDQQALVDFLVLSRSAYFMGMADSSFAWTIAVARRKTTDVGTCRFPAGFWKSKVWGTALRDEFSDLIGNHGYGWEDHMWP